MPTTYQALFKEMSAKCLTLHLEHENKPINGNWERCVRGWEACLFFSDTRMVIIGSKWRRIAKYQHLFFFLKLIRCPGLSLLFPLSLLSKYNFPWDKNMQIWENTSQRSYPTHYLISEPMWGWYCFQEHLCNKDLCSPSGKILRSKRLLE